MRILLTGLAIFTSAAFAQDAAQKCAALTGSKDFPNATTAITSAKLNSAAVEHCEVMGKINERAGANNQKYAIKFHMRLPANWNGRFFFEGGGGSNGNLGNAMGGLQGPGFRP